MPIRINENMPVVQRLRAENVFTMTGERARSQDIRELRILIVNIMPDKENTERQLLRLLSNSPLQTEVTFVRLESHHYKHTSEEYLASFYRPFSEICHAYWDGMIITGAPVENLPFEAVDYWQELQAIMDWSDTHVTTTMYICWAAQAGLYHHYGIEKHPFDDKLSGIYQHRMLVKGEELTRGFDSVFYAPHSRWTGVDAQALRRNPDLTVLAESDEAGPYLTIDRARRRVFVTGHPEYTMHTLAREYTRDVGKNMNPNVPVNYFPDNDPTQAPQVLWRSNAYLLFGNWLNYYVYQVTPYRLPEDE